MTSIVEETADELAQAEFEGLIPLGWRMMVDAWRNLRRELDPLRRELDPDAPPGNIYVGLQPAEPYLGLPITIIPGAQNGWELVCWQPHPTDIHEL